LNSVVDRLEVALKALCLHLGTTPSESFLPGFNTAAAPSESSIQSMLAAPVSGSTARSPVPKYAGVNRNAGHEDPFQKAHRISLRELPVHTSNNRHNLAARLVALEGRMEEWMKGVDHRLKDAGL